MAFAFVFPGQGSQSVGMMNAYGDSPVVRGTFDEASATLGQDLWQLVAEGPVELLAQTVNTQPLMLTAGIAAYRLWLEKGGKLLIRERILTEHSQQARTEFKVELNGEGSGADIISRSVARDESHQEYCSTIVGNAPPIDVDSTEAAERTPATLSAMVVEASERSLAVSARRSAVIWLAWR